MSFKTGSERPLTLYDVIVILFVVVCVVLECVGEVGLLCCVTVVVNCSLCVLCDVA